MVPLSGWLEKEDRTGESILFLPNAVRQEACDSLRISADSDFEGREDCVAYDDYAGGQ